MKRVMLLRAFVAAFLLAVLAGLLSFVSALVIILWSFQGIPRDQVQADCAVVFGAAIYGANRPGPAVVRRIGTAAELYRADQVQRLFLTGGKGGPEDMMSEAQAMQREALKHGVAAQDIVLEDQARSTLDNLRLTRPLTSGCKSIVAVSDQFHMARIQLLARREGWGSLKMVPTQGRPPHEREVRSVLREVLGYVFYAYRIDVFLDNEQMAYWLATEHLEPETDQNP